VNKQLSAKYETLVNDAPNLIKVLPWGPDFEVDIFRKPDFTALEVVTFATGGLWTSSNSDLHSVLTPIRYSRWYQRIHNIFFHPDHETKLYLILADTGKKCVATPKECSQLLQNYYDIRESTGFKNVSLAVSGALQEKDGSI
jgi:hypothetical protein